MMRSVCFVDRLELEFSGNHFSQAVTIGDVDNDGLNELLVGNVDGVLAIFKGDTSSKPWKKCSGLGTVTCVGVGDLFNTGRNVVVVINAESQCHLFIFDSIDPKSPSLSRNTSISSMGSINNAPEQLRSRGETPTSPSPNSRTMKPIHTQALEVPNVKVMCFAQIVPEEHWDLFVGHTDRNITVYRWNNDTRKLEMMQKISLPGQIGSLSVGHSLDRTPQLLISQPGGTYIPLMYQLVGEGQEQRKKKSNKSGFFLGKVIGQAQCGNPTSSTELVGSILDQSNCLDGEDTTPEENNIVALCMLDGVLRLLKNEVKQWELQVHHNLFAIGKLDLTGSGSDEIVACAWDGTTYILDHNRNCVRFQFDQNVSAFCCGYYGSSEGTTIPCLVYTTFSNCLYLYRDVTLPAIQTSNLLLTLQNRTLPLELKEKLDYMDSRKKQALFHYCLYQHNKCENTLQTK